MRKINTELLAIGIFLTLLYSCSENTKPDDGNNNNNNENGDPLISAITPASTYAGYPVEINGNHFGFERGDASVDINGKSPAEYIFWSYTKIIILLPEDASSGKVTIKDGEKSSNSVNLTIKEPSTEAAPVISFFDNEKPFVRSFIGIEGKNFGGERYGNFVIFNGIVADEYSLWRDRKIVVQVPTSAVSGEVTVYVNGQVSNAMQLEIIEDFRILEQALIPGGKFMMGSDEEPEAFNEPAHEVTITQPYYMTIYEITQEVYEQVSIYTHNSFTKGPNNPVERVSWLEACDFCNRLSMREKFEEVYTINGDEVTVDWEANGYRLPTEAEWEWAARAGSDWKYGLGKDGQPGVISGMAWHNENSDNSTHEVGQKSPNAFRLYDMLGNVMEWCWDWFDADYYSAEGNNIDPKGSETEKIDKVLRGGAYVHDRGKITCSYRWSNEHTRESEYYIGFRVVRNAR